MCGIYCCFSRHGFAQVSQNTRDLLQHRGPDVLQERYIERDGLYLTFISSVLSLRGETVVSQPLIDDQTGSLLCWNGEAWLVGNQKVTGNDSKAVFDLLLSAGSVEIDQALEILDAFSHIQGPYACVFYDSRRSQIYFGRDGLGRRSLVTTTAENGDLIISSVSTPDYKNWVEVEAHGMHVIHLVKPVRTKLDCECFDISIKTRCFANEEGQMRLPYPKLNMTIPVNAVPPLTLASQALEDLHSLLLKSMSLRLENLPGAPSTPLGILFSGGLDCGLLAYYAHQILPLTTPIDLLNVAFQNPRIHDMSLKDPYSTCPDRITGLSAYKALSEKFPMRQFRFVCINIPYSETMAHRETIMNLMHPHKTEMDLSIASALYFASRGQGSIFTTAPNSETYTTPTRVLLSGLGADELFAGYSRHAIAFDRHGYAALLAELELDAGRLGKRNLGRDDRVTSHWAREVRYPYLDEGLVAWAMAAPVWLKCGFGQHFERMSEGQEPGTDEEPNLDREKLLLRMLAWKFGLHSISKEKKRAIQFGSRTAKMHSGKIKGTDTVI